MYVIPAGTIILSESVDKEQPGFDAENDFIFC